MTSNKKNITIGDWVRGKTKIGELIQGFVEFLVSIESRVKVYVVSSE